MAASSFVLCLSLMLLVTTQGCSAQLGHKEPGLIPTLQGVSKALKCFSDSTVESLRLHKQNTAALSDLQTLHSLPDMLQLVKEQITLEMERNMGSLKKELAGLNKEAENTHEIQEIKSRLEVKDEKVTALTQEIQDLRAQLEARSRTIYTVTNENRDLRSQLAAKDKKVEQLTVANEEQATELADNRKQVQNLEERLSVSVQHVNNLTENEQRHDSTVQELNKRLQQSELRVQQLENTLQQLNETCKKEEVDQDPECRQFQLQKIKEVVQRFNSSKDLKQLGADLLSSLDSSSVEYQQLQKVRINDFITFWVGYRGHTQLVTLLLCAGLPVDTADRNGENMLFGAAAGGHVQLVKFLLKHRAQLEARGVAHFTPLIRVAYEGRLESVKVLVEAGANTTARDYYGRTALETAREYSRTAVVQYLQQLPH